MELTLEQYRNELFAYTQSLGLFNFASVDDPRFIEYSDFYTHDPFAEAGFAPTHAIAWIKDPEGLDDATGKLYFAWGVIFKAQAVSKAALGEVQMVAVAGKGAYSYTCNLHPKHGYELVVPSSITDVLSLTMEVIEKLTDDSVKFDTIGTLDGFTIAGKPTRYIVKAITPKEKEEYVIPMAINSDCDIYVVHVADVNNLLPGEPGYTPFY